MIRVVLPHHLRTLARVGAEVEVNVNGRATAQSVLGELEARYPMLRGTILDHESHKRRPMVRFFVCGEDVSHEPMDTPLPDAVTTGAEPFFIMGAIAGG
jgi:molybdopterin synthase sulfur carrier subunit